jgi:hypothetical protein
MVAQRGSLEFRRCFRYIRGMSFETLRRCIFVIAAFALLFVTVLPNNIVSTGMADMGSSATTLSAKMPCPDCNAGIVKSATSACEQMTCIGFAVIADGDSFTGILQRDFSQLDTLHLTEISLAPTTPPI